MKIYISGQISGMDIKEAERLFEDLEYALINAGHEAINPCKIVAYDPKYTYEHYMGEDIKELLRCEAIVMLDNWINSKGAKAELAVAQVYNLKIYYPHHHSLLLNP